METVDIMMGLEAAAAQANLLTTWTLAIIGGSIIALLQTSYLRPGNWRTRIAYLLFIPGWYFLGKSIYYGSEVRAVHLAGLFAPNLNENELLTQVGIDAANQSSNLHLGLLMFGVWLALYLAWWIYTDKPGTGD